MRNNDFLKDLKPGDKVIVRRVYGARVDTIEHITPTGQIKVKGDTYRFKNGERMGRGMWDKIVYLEPWSEAAEQKIKEEQRRAHMADYLNTLKFDFFSYTKLTKIMEIVEAKDDDRTE